MAQLKEIKDEKNNSALKFEILSFRKLVESYLDILKKYMDRVRNILDVHYDSLSRFYADDLGGELFNFNKNRCTVLVTRRCYLLSFFELYNRFLCDYSDSKVSKGKFSVDFEDNFFCITNKANQKKNYIIPDKAISLLGNEIGLANKIEEIVVLDDVCIHGRQLERIRTRIKDLIDNKQINIERHAYMVSKDSIIRPIENSCIESYNGKWVLLSRRIVECINFLNLPYVSYINSFTKFNVSDDESDSIINALNNQDNIIVKSFGNDDRELLGKESFFIVEQDSPYFKNEYLKCVRYYYNFETNTALFIPYVILNNLDTALTDQKDVLNILNQYLTETASKELIKIIKTLVGKENLMSDKGYLYSLISCVASNWYAFYFFDKYLKSLKIDATWIGDITYCIPLTFGKAIADLICNRKKYNFKILLNSIAKNPNDSQVKSTVPNNKDNQEEEIIKRKKIKDDLIDMIAIIEGYCGDRWTTRELAAVGSEEEPEKKSISELFKEFLNACGKEEDSLSGQLSCLCALIDYCDFGRLTISSGYNSADSYLEVGELGVLAARSTNNLNAKNKCKRLLRWGYYKFILV